MPDMLCAAREFRKFDAGDGVSLAYRWLFGRGSVANPGRVLPSSLASFVGSVSCLPLQFSCSPVAADFAL